MAPDLNHGHSLDANFLQRALYCFQFGVLDDCFNFRHDIVWSNSHFLRSDAGRANLYLFQLYSFSHGRDKSKPWTSSIVRFSAISLGCKINVNAIRRAHSIVCCDFREIETIYHSNLDLL
jgi:hypothetical protein